MSNERGSAEAGPLSAYLAGLDEPVRPVLADIVARARRLVPEAVEGVSYAMPALLLNAKGLLAVQQTAKHLALYPYSGVVVSAVAPLLTDFGHSRGAIRFSVDHPLPPELVDRIVLARREEIEAAGAR